ncbi:MAG TPA: biotin--[acetyl-CoA-carboxylase] ligase [Clostridiaceae bacterium]|nr:biotin--[acetyl-CoA-carboxylase] ligase [Clostridiaceae bacterium]
MKDLILKKLKQNLFHFVSGETLSQELNVSRTAIWKHIKDLRSEGYVIESFPKVGYRLISVPDVLVPSDISENMNTEFLGHEILYFKEIDSTNNYAKKIAYEGCKDGTVVIAERQTSGRGRLGRTWESDKGNGIWMSVILRPDISPEAIQLITLASSVAVVEAIKDTTGIATGIKWPNDILLDGKKLCGILVEMSSEMDRINFVVIGIGINIGQDNRDFSENLRNKAISLKSYIYQNNINIEFTRSMIVGKLLTKIEKYYNFILKGRTEEIIQNWKKYSVVLGKEVVVSSRDGDFTGIAEDLTEEGKLVIRSFDGVTQLILSGEISLKSY